MKELENMLDETEKILAEIGKNVKNVKSKMKKADFEELRKRLQKIVQKIDGLIEGMCEIMLGELKFGDVIRLKNGKTVMVMEIRDNKDTPIWYVEIEGNESGGCRWGDIESKEVIMDG